MRFEGEQIPHVGLAEDPFLKTLKCEVKIKTINHTKTGNNVKQALLDSGNELNS